MRRLLEPLFALDTRSLALFRVALGLLVVLDAVGRLADASAHYSDAGAVPRALVNELRGDSIPFSLYFLHGSAAYAGALLLLHALAGVCVLVGYRTRLATAAVWLLTISVHHRNLLVANWGDAILRMLLFWSLFVPLSERASLDRRRAADPPAQRFLGGGSAAFVIQLGCVYFFSYWLKTGPEWQDGSAVALSLANPDIAKLPQAAFALGYPQILALLSHAVLALELVGPLLLLVPVRGAVLRTLLVLAFWAFHLGLFTFLELGLFPFVCIAAWSALIPGEVWDRLGVRAANGPRIVRRRQWLALACLALVLASNLNSLRAKGSLPAPIGAALRLTGLYQKWGMFAPGPETGDGWLVAVGRRRDGRDEDLLRGGDPPLAQRPDDSALYPNVRWRTYARAIWHRRPAVRRGYAEWMCRRRAGELESVTIYYVKEVGTASGAPEPVQIWQQRCAAPPTG